MNSVIIQMESKMYITEYLEFDFNLNRNRFRKLETNTKTCHTIKYLHPKVNYPVNRKLLIKARETYN